jgi:predicted nucleic-acid-binding protein
MTPKNKEVIIPDTNVFLRFILNDIKKQALFAEKLFGEAKKGKIVLFTPQIVVFEISFVLDKLYRFSKEQIIENIGIIVANDIFNVQDRAVFIKALEIFKNNNISLADSFLKAMEGDKFKIFTFDKKLNQI